MINEMSCSNGVFQMNARNTYTCRTTLTGLKNNELGASGGYLEESMEEIKTADNLNEINDILEELNKTR